MLASMLDALIITSEPLIGELLNAPKSPTPFSYSMEGFNAFKTEIYELMDNNNLDVAFSGAKADLTLLVQPWAVHEWHEYIVCHS